MKYIICFFMLFFVKSYAASMQCYNVSPPVQPQVIMNIAPFNLTYDFTKNESEIKDMASDKGGENSIVRGLTVGSFSSDMETRYMMSEVSGGYCVIPKEVVINLMWSPVNVFVENKYNENSCQHQAILEHENKHVLIYKRTMEQYGDIIKNDFDKAVNSNYYPVFVPEGNSVKETIEAPLNNLLKQEEDNFKMTLNERNQQLDAPVSIAYTQNECDQW